jgi:uncharacterized SAM-binding protein YcdF (DUF218 family)
MTAVLVMGKQVRRRENVQLQGRAAVAAAVWHSLGDPELAVVHVAADTHGPVGTPDGTVLRALLTGRYRLPDEVVITREWSRCTVAEVRALRVLARARGIGRVLAVTHGYHARRVAAYLAEAGLAAEVLTPDVATLARFPLPAEVADLGPLVADAVARATPGPLDLVRERANEALLTRLHRLDPRGRVERILARVFRG